MSPIILPTQAGAWVVPMSNIQGSICQGDVLPARFGSHDLSVTVIDALQIEGSEAHRKGLVSRLLELYHGPLTADVLEFYKPSQSYTLLFVRLAKPA